MTDEQLIVSYLDGLQATTQRIEQKLDTHIQQANERDVAAEGRIASLEASVGKKATTQGGIVGGAVAGIIAGVIALVEYVRRSG